MEKKLIYIVIFCLALGLRLYAVAQKDFIHHDEPFTFFNSTPSNILPDDNKTFKKGWNYYFIKYNKEYQTKDLKKAFFGSDKSLKALVKDLKMIRSQNIDSSHPILYYSVFRIFNTGFDGNDWHEGIMRGCFLNLILFTLSFFFLYKLLNTLFPNDLKMIALGLFFAFCNTGSISNTILLREYAIAELFFNLSVYILARIYIKNISNNEKLSVYNYLLYPLVFALLAQTGYFSFIFDLILVATLLLLALFNKKFKFLFNIIILSLLTFAWIIIIYPNYFDSLLNNEHIGRISTNVNNGVSFWFFYLINYVDYLFYKLFIIITLIFYMFAHNKAFKNLNLLCLPIIPIFIWNISIITICSMIDLRFIAPSYPILALICLFFIYPLKRKIIYLLLFLYFESTIFSLCYNDFRYSKINYLHNDEEITYYKGQNADFSDKNVVIYMPEDQKKNSWFYTYLIFKHLNNGIIIFDNNFKKNKYDNIYLMLGTTNGISLKNNDKKLVLQLGPYAYHGHYGIYNINKK